MVVIRKSIVHNRHTDDKELFLIISKFGLLEILCKAKQFPSVSTAVYHLLNKRKICMESHTSFSAESILKKCLQNIRDHSSSFIQCQMDSMYGDARVRWWNPKINLLYGFCWEHSRDVHLVLDNVETIDNIKKVELHILRKEFFVLGFTGSGKTFMPVATIEEQQN